MREANYKAQQCLFVPNARTAVSKMVLLNERASSPGRERGKDHCMSRNEKSGIALKPIYIIIGVVAAVAVMAASVLLGLQQRPAQAESSFTPDLQQGTSAWSGDALPDKTPESSGEAVGIKIPGYPSISLPADQQDVEVALLNPEGNPCYFTFELVLTDTGEVLYTSKQVEPGQMITNITLNRALPAGQYNAELRVTTASLQDGSAMNGANVVTVLDVQ